MRSFDWNEYEDVSMNVFYWWIMLCGLVNDIMTIYSDIWMEDGVIRVNEQDEHYKQVNEQVDRTDPAYHYS